MFEQLLLVRFPSVGTQAIECLVARVGTGTFCERINLSGLVSAVSTAQVLNSREKVVLCGATIEEMH